MRSARRRRRGARIGRATPTKAACPRAGTGDSALKRHKRSCLSARRSRWTDPPDSSARIEQTVYVARDGHKKIVIGEGGRTIKAIGAAARKEIAEAKETPGHLFLFVKVRENWLDDPERYRAMGLEFPEEVGGKMRRAVAGRHWLG